MRTIRLLKHLALKDVVFTWFPMFFYINKRQGIK